jgi:hypothetical protein
MYWLLQLADYRASRGATAESRRARQNSLRVSARPSAAAEACARQCDNDYVIDRDDWRTRPAPPRPTMTAPPRASDTRIEERADDALLPPAIAATERRVEV